MLQAGDVYLVEIPNEKTDHYWVIVTDISGAGKIAYVMLTDAKNLEMTQTTLPAGTKAWGSFSLTKTTAVDVSRARLTDAVSLSKAMKISGKFQGQADSAFLDEVRQVLRSSTLTDPDVRKAL